MIFSIGNYKIDTQNVVMVLEIDHLTESKRGRFLFDSTKNKNIIVTDEFNLPLSALVVSENGENKMYLTPMTPQTLIKHLGGTLSKKEANLWF